jgi:peptidyl-prolyl cis-trans isomerase D
MLQNIRNNIQGMAAKVIIAIIVVPFAFFGIDSLFQSSGPKAVAEINGEDISEAELSQALTMQKRRLIGMMGDQIDPSMLDDAVLRKPALNTLIKQELMLQTAENSNIVISKEQLNATIASMPQFHESGRFSQARYEQVLRMQGYSSAMFKQLLRSDLTIQQLSNGLAGSAFVTEAQLSRLVEVLHETRDYQFIPVPFSSFEDSVEVSSEEIQSFYESAPEKFQSEEKVRVSYLELKESQFYKPVAEEQVQAEYQRMIAGLEQETEREAGHILVEINDDRSREEAEEVLNGVKRQLADGADFTALANKYSDDAGSAKQGGTLGFTTGDSFPVEFEDALSQLDEGDVSDIVETDAGLHLIKLLSIRQPKLPSLEESRGEITERLREQKAKPELVAAVEELRDLVFNAEGLQMPAERMGLEIKQSELLSRSDESEIFANNAVRQAAFDSRLRKDDLNSDVFELSPEHYIVIHVEDYAEPETLPLSEVQGGIVEALRSKKTREMALSKAKELAAQLRDGKRAETAAKEAGLKWEAIAAGKRSANNVEMPVRDKAFALPQPENGPSVGYVQNEESYVVIQVNAVTLGDVATLDKAALNASKQGLYKQQMGQDFSSYFNTLWTNSDIEIR